LIRLPLRSTIRASMTNLLCGESRLNPQESTVVNITLISGRTLPQPLWNDARGSHSPGPPRPSLYRLAGCLRGALRGREDFIHLGLVSSLKARRMPL
jgi:hypothetical protein